MSATSRGARHALITALTVITATLCLLLTGLAPADAATAGQRRGATPHRVDPSPHGKTHAAARVGRTAVHLAASQAGKPYRYGATGPRAFDCSGLTQFVWKVRLKRNLPRTADAQMRAVQRVAKRAVRPGDLVFFLSGGRAYHVGIYAGRGRIWHAPYTGTRVRLERIWTSHWVAGRPR